MAEAPHFILYEHAIGYVLFKVKEFEDIGLILPQVQNAVNDVQRFSSIVSVHGFSSFQNTDIALENFTHVSEGMFND